MRFFPAFTAESVEFKAMAQDQESGFILDPGIQVLKGGVVQIFHASASITDHMIMRFRIRFKTIICAVKVDFLHQSLFDQNGQISVNRSQTESWKLFFELDKKPVSRRMPFCGLQDFENTFPLFCFSVHGAEPDKKMIRFRPSGSGKSSAGPVANKLGFRYSV